MLGRVLAVSCIFLVAYHHGAAARDVPTSEEIPRAGGCTVPFADLPYPEQPLILIPGTEKYWYPLDETREILVPTGAPIELACQQGFRLFPTQRSITVQCVTNSTFSFGGSPYPMKSLACTSYWLSSAKTTQARCHNESVIVKVGFELADARWVNVFDVCYDEQLYHTHFVRHHMNRANGGYQSGNPRPGWYQGAYYTGVNINTLYTVNKQRETIATILNSQARADVLVQNTTNGIYMARGHIAARADFVYGTEQNATFWFLNAAPQWQNFNGVNWERVESSVRDFVGKRDLELTVYSGTYGVQKLADGNGDYREIWLDFDPVEGRRRAPAPMLYYKILHDEASNAGIALVGVNNVHVPVELILREYVLCKDIGDEVEWIDWERKNLTIGYCYACEVNAFNDAIGRPHPQLNVAKLLTSSGARGAVFALGLMLAGLGLHALLFVVRSSALRA